MKKIIILFIFSILLVPLSIKAITKEEVLDYVNSQSSIDSETASLIDKYALQFTKLIESKELSEEQLNDVYDNLVRVNELAKEYKIEKKEDLDKVSDSVKSIIKDSIYDSVLIIAQAPSSTGEASSVTINEDSTIDLVIDGSLVDKIDLSTKTFNYVGISKNYLYIIIISLIIFILSIYIIIKYKKNRFLSNLFIPSSVVSFIIIITFCLFSNQISRVVSLSQLFKKNEVALVVKKALVNKDHKVEEYPSYKAKYALLTIPRLSIEENVVYGDDNEILNSFIGHDTTSYLPGEGKTIIYSVHNYKVKNLESIKNNDKIIVKTDYASFTYQVEKTKIMNTNEYNKIVLKDNKEKLVLYTCYPFNISLYNNKRFVVFANLIKEEWFVS